MDKKKHLEQLVLFDERIEAKVRCQRYHEWVLANADREIQRRQAQIEELQAEIETWKERLEAAPAKRREAKKQESVLRDQRKRFAADPEKARLLGLVAKMNELKAQLPDGVELSDLID
jgi:chromosome segregation ATPase